MQKAEKKKSIELSYKDKEYWEARQNLFGFFSLLLDVDKRINPQLYKKPENKNKNDR